MPPTYDLAISGEVLAALGRNRMDRRQLAVELGRSPSYLSRRLNGSVPWSAADLKVIADLLGIPVAELTNPRQLAS